MKRLGSFELKKFQLLADNPLLKPPNLQSNILTLAFENLIFPSSLWELGLHYLPN